MIIIIGLVILVAAVIAGVAGVLTNSGSSHALTHFAVFGYHVTGSTGTLFLYGIVLGAIGVFGLSLLLGGARRTSRRGHAARRGLKQSRQETAAASQARDDLLDERESARAYNAGIPANGTPRAGHQPEASRSRWDRLNRFGHGPATTSPAADPATTSPATDPAPAEAAADSPGAPGAVANGSRP